METEQESGKEETRYHVVMNDEEQYSIWWTERELPVGWRTAGVTGTRAECLRAIEDLWTDMRPRSLRTRGSAPEGG